MRALKSEWWEGWGDRTYQKRLSHRVRRQLDRDVVREELGAADPGCVGEIGRECPECGC